MTEPIIDLAHYIQQYKVLSVSRRFSDIAYHRLSTLYTAVGGSIWEQEVQ